MRPFVEFAQGLDSHFGINLSRIETGLTEQVLNQAYVLESNPGPPSPSPIKASPLPTGLSRRSPEGEDGPVRRSGPKGRRWKTRPRPLSCPTPPLPKRACERTEEQGGIGHKVLVRKRRPSTKPGGQGGGKAVRVGGSIRPWSFRRSSRKRFGICQLSRPDVFSVSLKPQS